MIDNNKEKEMKVGIIGITPRQRDSISDLNLAIQLVVYEENHYTKASVTGFADKVDDLIVLAGHVPKPALLYAPKSKTHFMGGNVGVSAVIRYLTGKYPRRPEPKADAKIILKHTAVGKSEPTQKNPPTHIKAPIAIKPTEESENIVKATLDKIMKPSLAVPELDWVFSMVDGKSSGTKYRNSLLASDASRVVPGPNGRYSHRLLDAAIPGDVLRYARRKSDDNLATMGLFAYVYRTYSKRIGYALEVHVHKTYCDVYVTDRQVSKQKGMHFTTIDSPTVFQDYLNGKASLDDAGDAPIVERSRSADAAPPKAVDPSVYDDGVAAIAPIEQMVRRSEIEERKTSSVMLNWTQWSFSVISTTTPMLECKFLQSSLNPIQVVECDEERSLFENVRMSRRGDILRFKIAHLTRSAINRESCMTFYTDLWRLFGFKIEMHVFNDYAYIVIVSDACGKYGLVDGYVVEPEALRVEFDAMAQTLKDITETMQTKLEEPAVVPPELKGVLETSDERKLWLEVYTSMYIWYMKEGNPPLSDTEGSDLAARAADRAVKEFKVRLQ